MSFQAYAFGRMDCNRKKAPGRASVERLSQVHQQPYHTTAVSPVSRDSRFFALRIYTGRAMMAGINTGTDRERITPEAKE